MAKKMKDKPVVDEELPSDDVEVEEVEGSADGNKPKKNRAVPKHAVNFTDKEINSMNIEAHVKGLLKAKREADREGDKVTARKLRRALRNAGFYVSKVRED